METECIHPTQFGVIEISMMSDPMALTFAFLSPLPASASFCRHASISAGGGRTSLRTSRAHRAVRVVRAALNPIHEDALYQRSPLHVDDTCASGGLSDPFAPYEAESAVGGGIVDGGSGSDAGGRGDSGDGSGDNDDESLEAVLRNSNRTLEDLPADARNLTPEALLSYARATSSPFSAFLARAWPGWMLRCAADAEFPFKVLMELTVGLGLSSSGMIAARGKDIIKELDFAICDIAVGAAVNFLLVYLLTPTFAPPGAKLSAVARLPANVFIAGAYSLPSRVATLLYKGALFGVCGFCAALAGTAASQGLIAVRRVVAPDAPVNTDMPNVLATASAWAGFMCLSANPRYQAIAGIERGLFTFAPDTFAKLGSGLLRTGNNVVGGASWVWWARYVGLQPQKPVDPVMSSAE